MAADYWFQTWHPPSGLVADQNPFSPPHLHNYSSPIFPEPSITNITQNRHTWGPPDLLPFLLSFSVLKPPDDSRKSKSFRATPSKSEQEFSHNDYTDDKYFGNTESEVKNFHESVGPFRTKYAWKRLDFKYPSSAERETAILLEEFIPDNNLPLGVEVWKNRLFVTMPKWKPGVPCTLAVLPTEPKELSPALVPYPSWRWHKTESCAGLTSVFRVQADDCGRLWVLDSGQIEVTIKPKQVCPPAIYIFNLKTDKLILRYELPKAFIKEDSLYSNILIDNRDGDCSNVHAYLTDVWRYGLVVFSLKRLRSWRITDHLFYPEPLAAAYNVHDLEFEWTDGLFGLALSPWDPEQKDRLLYFHPMSSFREFYVQTSVICNETGWDKVKDAFKVLGQSRGKSGHVSASAVDRNGVMFYNLVTRDSIGCWDTRKPYRRNNLGLVAKHNEMLVFPNDLKIDKEKRQSVWIITNKLPFYLYRGLHKHRFNFRILSAYTDEAVKGSVCDPEVTYGDAYEHFPEVEDCY